MRISRLRISILAAVAVVGATAAVALGAPTRAHDNNLSAVQHAFTKTSKITSGHFSFTVAVSGGATAQTGGAITLGGTGGFDAKHQASTFTLDLGPLAAALGSLGGSNSVSIPQKVDVVTLKTALYVHIPSLAAQAGGAGKQWLKIDAGKLPKTGGVSPGQVTSTSPTKALAALKSSITVHKLGSTKVRGSSTTHYRVSVNATKAVKTLVPKSQQAAQLKSLKTAGLSTVPLDVYVDGSGYVRRVQLALKNLKSQGSPSSSVTVSVDIYDVGTSVHVSAPPASQTADGTNLISGLLGSVGGGG